MGANRQARGRPRKSVKSLFFADALVSANADRIAVRGCLYWDAAAHAGVKEAYHNSYNYIRTVDASPFLYWLFADLDEIDEIFGGDPWPYGIEPNRPTLDAFMQYLVDQNFIPEPIAIDDLFVPVS